MKFFLSVKDLFCKSWILTTKCCYIRNRDVLSMVLYLILFEDIPKLIRFVFLLRLYLKMTLTTQKLKVIRYYLRQYTVEWYISVAQSTPIIGILKMSIFATESSQGLTNVFFDRQIMNKSRFMTRMTTLWHQDAQRR